MGAQFRIFFITISQIWTVPFHRTPANGTAQSFTAADIATIAAFLKNNNSDYEKGKQKMPLVSQDRLYEGVLK